MTFAPADMNPLGAHCNHTAAANPFRTHDNLCPTVIDTY